MGIGEWISAMQTKEDGSQHQEEQTNRVNLQVEHLIQSLKPLYNYDPEKYQLRPYQTNIVNQVIDLFKIKDLVTLSLACGGGKTGIGINVAFYFKKALFVSSSPTQLESSAVRDFLNCYYTKYGIKIDFSPEKINNPDRDDPIEFWSLQTLVIMSKKNPDRFRGIMDRADLLICDEAHRMPQIENEKEEFTYIDKIHRLAKKFFLDRGKKVLCMSGTFFRPDGFLPLGGNKDGSVDIKVTMQDLIHMGCAPNLAGAMIYIDAEWHSKRKKGNIYKLKFKGENRRKYIKAIVDSVKHFHKLLPWGGHCLFTSSRADCDYLTKVLNEALRESFGKDAFVSFHAKNYPDPKERDEVIKKIEDGELLGYVTCAIGAESISIKRLQICHLILRTTSEVRLLQILGRIMRMHDKKQFALIVDYRSQKDKLLKGVKGFHTIVEKEHSRIKDPINGGLLFELGPHIPLPEGENNFNITKITIGEDEMWIEKCAFKTNEEEIKAKLIELAKSGASKPRQDGKDPVERRYATALSRYINKNKTAYDPIFTAEIKNIAPEWFDSRKCKLLGMISNNIDILKLGYKNADRRAFLRFLKLDKRFREAVRKINPIYLKTKEDVREEKYQEVLDLVKKRSPKISYKHPLYGRFGRMMRNSSKIRKTVQKRNPEWSLTNIDRFKERRKKIIELMKNKRPKLRPSHPWYFTFLTLKKIDKEFRKIAVEIGSDWINSKKENAEKQRRKLLKMAREGKEKIGMDHPQYHFLVSQISTNKKFRKELQKANPKWLKKNFRFQKRREKLIAMSHAGCPKPTYKDSFYHTFYHGIRTSKDFRMRLHKDWLK